MSEERLHAVVHDGDGPFALLVHGALGSRSYWRDNVEALRAVCRPVVVELWGHGRSPSPAEHERYLPAAYVEQFELLRRELGAERWFTIGQSMGAGLVLHYGLAHPDRVAAQVVTNSLSAFAKAEGWPQLHARTVDPVVARLHTEGTGFLRHAKLNPASSRRIDAATRALLAAEFAEHDAVGLAHSMRHTTAALPLGERLAELRPPTLLTVGVREEQFLRLVPRARRMAAVEVVELDAGHPVNAQDPHRWNEAVVAFLARHR
ncbi:MAG: alpha/beta fold hydrolase [Acidimicrobiia bacterium]